MQTVVAHVNEFSEFGVKLLSMYIDMAIENKQSTLPVIIDSYGGEVYSLNAMVDLLQGCGLNIVTIVYGKAMSCGAFLFGVGQKRYMSKNATIMIHDAGICIGYKKNPEVQANAKEVQRLNNKLYSMLDKSCSKPSGFFRGLVKENDNADLFLSPEECLSYGLATNIGVPTINEIDQALPFEESEQPGHNMDDNHKYKILMQYSEIDKNIDNGGLSKMDLQKLQEQVTALSTQVKSFQDESSSLRAELKAREVELKTKESEFSALKAQFDSLQSKAKEVEKTAKESQVSAFAEKLLQEKKITKDEVEAVKADLLDPDVINNEKVMEKIKASYEKRQPIGGHELPDFGDRNFNMSPKDKNGNTSAYYAMAEKMKLDPANIDNASKILDALDTEWRKQQSKAVFG